MTLDPEFSGLTVAYIHLTMTEVMFCHVDGGFSVTLTTTCRGDNHRTLDNDFDCLNYGSIYANILQVNTKRKFVFLNPLKQMFVNWHNC